MAHLGEILSLMAALMWALAIVLFRKSGENVHPVALNAIKNVMASGLILLTLYVSGGTLFHDATRGEYLLLVASGVIGLAVGDTLTFQSLNIIGAGRSALVNCLYSPVIIVMSYFWLGERITPMQIVGVVLIITAILETAQVHGKVEVGRLRQFVGVMYGVGGMVAMGVAVVMIKPLLDRSPLLWTIEIRLLGAVVALLVFLILNPKRKRIISTLFVRESRLVTVSSSLIGGYLAMMAWLGGLKYTQASIAGALGQTSTIFILILAALILKERITLMRATAIGLATIGALMVTFG